MWRVLKGLHRRIEISFMLVGHTKFSPDWCFGLLKQRFRVTEVGCLDDLVRVVTSSAEVNEAQLVGDQQGQPLVPMYDWVGFFGSRVKKVPHITQQHHFRFTSDSPGSVLIQEFSDSEEREFHLTSEVSLAEEFPEAIVPKGLPLQRRWYLHDKIREFCPDHTKDVVCPKPSAPRPSATPPPRSSPTTNPPGPVRLQLSARVCRLCGESGHNRRTCPQKPQQ